MHRLYSYWKGEGRGGSRERGGKVEGKGDGDGQRGGGERGKGRGVREGRGGERKDEGGEGERGEGIGTGTGMRERRGRGGGNKQTRSSRRLSSGVELRGQVGSSCYFMVAFMCN